MATLTTQSVVHAGTDITFAAAAGGGDLAATGPTVILLVKNGDASGKTVTLATPGTVDGLAIADRTVTVDAGDQTAIPLPSELYQDATDGYAHITYSAVTSVTVAVVKV